jgi:hypothetical protein
MLTRLFVDGCVMAVCVVIHAAGLSAALRYLRRIRPIDAQFWLRTRLFIVVAGWMVLLHLSEIVVWGLFFVWKGAIPDLQAALYFSAVTYTTTGYGDVVLPEAWRLAGGVESLTGILMCGWSSGFFFAVVNRLYQPGDLATK